MTSRQRGVQRVMGCGCAGVLVIVVVATLVLWTLSFADRPSPLQQLQPVPKNVPPNGGVEVADINVHGPGRTADKLTYWAADLSEQTKIPAQALRAYGNAELIARDAWPQCHLRWNTLAGIGWVETRHGTYSGNWLKPSELNEEGMATPAIIGIQLNGENGTAVVADTDRGEWDTDAQYDRAMGPMQFIPESWRRNGLDANGDGVANPQQIDDAALSAAKLLCSYGRDLETRDGWVSAVHAYNQSTEYMRRVAAAANSYAVPQPATS